MSGNCPLNKETVLVLTLRIQELGFWDDDVRGPVCGWLPFIQGWLVVSHEVSPGIYMLFINGLSWCPGIPDSAYARRAHLYK